MTHVFILMKNGAIEMVCQTLHCAIFEAKKLRNSYGSAVDLRIEIWGMDSYKQGTVQWEQE